MNFTTLISLIILTIYILANEESKHYHKTKSTIETIFLYEDEKAWIQRNKEIVESMDNLHGILETCIKKL